MPAFAPVHVDALDAPTLASTPEQDFQNVANSFVGQPLTANTLSLLNIQLTNTWTNWNRIYTIQTTAGTDTLFETAPLSLNTGTYVSSVTTNIDTWGRWNQIFTVTNNNAITNINVPILLNNTWASWNSNFVVCNDLRASVETPEQRMAREARYAKEQEERLAADARAEKLLTEYLTVEQRESYKKEGYFYLTSVSSGRRYRIKKGRSRNIEEVDSAGKRLRVLCAHPQEMVPDADTVLAQALYLRHREDDFLKIANVS